MEKEEINTKQDCQKVAENVEFGTLDAKKTSALAEPMIIKSNLYHRELTNNRPSSTKSGTSNGRLSVQSKSSTSIIKNARAVTPIVSKPAVVTSTAAQR